MHGCITPSLIKESTSTIQVLEIFGIRLLAIKVQASNFEVAPEMAEVVVTGNLLIVWASGLGTVDQEVERVVGSEILRVATDEFFGTGPESFDGCFKLVHGDDETVDFVVGAHEGKWVAIAR